MKEKLMFKIRRKRDGLYSKGGMDAKNAGTYHWSKNGKIWQGLGPLKNHLAQFKDRAGNYVLPEDWEIVSIKTVIYEGVATPVHEFLGVKV